MFAVGLKIRRSASSGCVRPGSVPEAPPGPSPPPGATTARRPSTAAASRSHTSSWKPSIWTSPSASIRLASARVRRPRRRAQDRRERGVLVGREAAHGQADAEVPPAAERDLGPPVVAPDEALPEAVRRRKPARMALEHVGQAGAADLLGALADPEERDRRRRVALDEPELDRLQPRGDVGLVVAGAPRVDAPSRSSAPNGSPVPCGRVAGRLDVVVRVDEDAVGAGPRQLAEDDRRSAGCLVELDTVEEALHPRRRPSAPSGPARPGRPR